MLNNKTKAARQTTKATALIVAVLLFIPSQFRVRAAGTHDTSRPLGTLTNSLPRSKPIVNESGARISSTALSKPLSRDTQARLSETFGSCR